MALLNIPQFLNVHFLFLGKKKFPWILISLDYKLNRIRKGKACARPEDEDQSPERPPLGFLGSSIPAEKMNRPLIRPVHAETPHETNAHSPPVAIPPPPAKHVEREKFFQEKKVDGSSLAGHMKSLSLHSRNASSSRSGSMDFSD